MEDPQWIAYAKNDLFISMDHKLHTSNSMNQQHESKQPSAVLDTSIKIWNRLEWNGVGWNAMQCNTTEQNRIVG